VALAITETAENTRKNRIRIALKVLSKNNENPAAFFSLNEWYSSGKRLFLNKLYKGYGRKRIACKNY
jgi:hypothetical protein